MRTLVGRSQTPVEGDEQGIKEHLMERERQKRPWREIDRQRDHSQHKRSDPEADQKRDQVARAHAETREVRSALEALFAPKADQAPTPVEPVKSAPRIVLPPNPNADPRNAERRRLLNKLLTAAGPGAVSKVANEFLAQGFEFPADQEVYLQLLEHVDEQRAREAIHVLSKILAGESPKKKHVLDQRLRRIEDHAEEQCTREAASALRRLVQGRPAHSQARAK